MTGEEAVPTIDLTPTPEGLDKIHQLFLETKEESLRFIIWAETALEEGWQLYSSNLSTHNKEDVQIMLRRALNCLIQEEQGRVVSMNTGLGLPEEDGLDE